MRITKIKTLKTPEKDLLTMSVIKYFLPLALPLSCQQQKTILKQTFKNALKRQGAVAHAWNPSTLGGQAGRITWGKEFETNLANMVKHHLYQINRKIQN